MSVSLRLFRLGLYEEHLEEASFLYAQCRLLRADPEIAWFELEGFEERLRAHLDALALGGELAASFCAEHAAAGDAGERYAALALFAMTRDHVRAHALVADCDASDREVVDALVAALRVHSPPHPAGSSDAWSEAMQSAAADSALWAELAANVPARLQARDAPWLRATAAHGEGPAQLACVRALGHARDEESARVLAQLVLGAETEELLVTAVVAALRSGVRGLLPELLPRAPQYPRVVLPLAHVAGADAARSLVRAAADLHPAVGIELAELLGDPAAVPSLVERLRDAEHAGAAARALVTITGAALLESVQVVPVPDDDEDQDQDAGAQVVVRPSRDPGLWAAWWDEHGPRFAAGRRYRYGELAEPRQLLRCLERPDVPMAVRQHLYDELALRHRHVLACDTQDPVRVQRAELARLARASLEAEAGGWQVGH